MIPRGNLRQRLTATQADARKSLEQLFSFKLFFIFFIYAFNSVRAYKLFTVAPTENQLLLSNQSEVLAHRKTIVLFRILRRSAAFRRLILN